jgi:uncharacterized membrane protein YoaK (UPF0700 family)
MEDPSRAVRDGLLVLLTLTTGAVDASCFLHLGHVFSSVITGNLVLLAVAAGTHDPSLAIHSGVALAGYSAGVLAAAPIGASRAGAGTWPPSVTVTLVAEFCVLAVFCAGWEITAGRPGDTAQVLLIAALAVAMGMQSAAVRKLGGMSTTYLTGTLTSVIAGLVTRDRPPGFARSIGVLVAIVPGAVAGSVVAQDAPAWLPAVILAPLAGVVIASVAGFEPVKIHFHPRRGRP